MPPTWSDATDLHRHLAAAAPDDIRPLLAGFSGDDGIAAVELRPFAPGQYRQPIIEAMALLVPLGCDRVSLGMPARAWSMVDPIPPVSAAGDLRQRVLMEIRVDGHGQRAEVELLLHPFAVHDGTLRWEPTIVPGPGEGWIPGALTTIIDSRTHLGSSHDDESTLHQLARLNELGHRVAFAPVGERRLLAIATALADA